MTNGMDVLPPAGNEDNYNFDPMRFFRNDTGKFVSRENLLGLTDMEDGKGLLTFDYDRDGDLDVFLVNTGGPPKLYRNDGGNFRGFLRVEVVGTTRNRSGLGARVSVTAHPGFTTQVRHIGIGTHYQGQSEFAAHFGLNGIGASPVHEVRVFWPVTGEEQILTDVPRNRTLVVHEAVL